MHLQKASRKKASIKMSLQGPSGSGKTYSSLLIAHGLCNDWYKIAVIDSENHSSELYSHLGSYNVLQLSAPYTPEKYIQAIEACGQAGMQVIIIDSISHEWEYILEAHASLPGNSFTNWQKIGLRHKAFIQSILGSKAHIIATTRTKQDYVLNFAIELLSETSRDAYASTLKRNGRSIEEIAEMLGHTSTTCTRNYLAQFEDSIIHNINQVLP